MNDAIRAVRDEEVRAKHDRMEGFKVSGKYSAAWHAMLKEGWTPRSMRKDLHLMLLLEDLQKRADSLRGEKIDTQDMVPATEYEQLWFGVNTSDVFEHATDHELREMAACGLCLDEDTGDLFIHV